MKRKTKNHLNSLRNCLSVHTKFKEICLERKWFHEKKKTIMITNKIWIYWKFVTIELKNIMKTLYEDESKSVFNFVESEKEELNEKILLQILSEIKNEKDETLLMDAVLKKNFKQAEDILHVFLKYDTTYYFFDYIFAENVHKKNVLMIFSENYQLANKNECKTFMDKDNVTRYLTYSKTIPTSTNVSNVLNYILNLFGIQRFRDVTDLLKQFPEGQNDLMNFRDGKGNTVLMKLIEAEKLDEIVTLLDQYEWGKNYIEHKNNDGQNAKTLVLKKIEDLEKWIQKLKGNPMVEQMVEQYKKIENKYNDVVRKLDKF